MAHLCGTFVFIKAVATRTMANLILASIGRQYLTEFLATIHEARVVFKMYAKQGTVPMLAKIISTDRIVPLRAGPVQLALACAQCQQLHAP